jgi:hypothetical protein
LKKRAPFDATVKVDFRAEEDGSLFCTVPFEADEVADVRRIARERHRSFEHTLLFLLRGGCKVLLKRKGGLL